MTSFLATGFRPFFLIAAMWAVVAPLLWVAVLQDSFTLASPLDPLSWHIHEMLASPLDPLSWHIHEMLFGFAGAVIAGFLLTAVRNWTKQPTLSGAGLATVVGLWVVARAQTFVDLGQVGLVLDLAFFPALAFGIGRPMWVSRNRRNAVFPVLLLMLGVADAALHAGWLTPKLVGQVGLDVVTLIIVIIGGRIIPMFTKNAIAEVALWRHGLVELTSSMFVAALLVGDLLGLQTGPMALGAGVVNLVRLAGWGWPKTLRAPIVWVLHVGYFWTAAALTMRGVGELVVALPPSASTHLLTIGGIGTLTLGMMSRVALGHTGRAIVAARSVGVAFALVSVATVFRAIWSLGSPHIGWLQGAAVVFSAAFAIYFVVFAPILTSPRADGRPG